MPRTRIKICGIRTPDAARAAVDAGADAIGLVFVPGTPRAVTLQEAEVVLRVLPPFVEPVALFVNAPPGSILDTCKQLGLRSVQLHGKEAPATAAAIAPLRVVKAIAFDPATLDRKLEDWTSASMANVVGILWDAPPPEKGRTAAQTGGHGQAFDWAEFAKLLATNPAAHTRATILAGGLNPQNVAQATAAVRPYAVDVSSGVESSRGVKDAGLIAQFCQAVRGADEQSNQAPG